MHLQLILRQEHAREVKQLPVQKGIHFTICHLQLHRRVYLQRLRQQMRMADIILERNKRSIMFFVQK